MAATHCATRITIQAVLMGGVLACTCAVAKEKQAAPTTDDVPVADEISFLATGKAINQRQLPDGTLTVLNYHFYAEIFLEDGQQLHQATLHFPPEQRRAAEPFENLRTLWKTRGVRYRSMEEMDRAYPNGTYRFVARTAHGHGIDRSFRVGGTGGARPIPGDIRVTLTQGGRPADPANIDASQDLTVVWTPFALGRADPNGIIDDMIFVSVIDCEGKKIDHSGAAFSEKGALSYSARQYVVRADRLQPGTIYPLFVEHVIADTSRVDGVPGMVANAAITYLDFKTRGTRATAPCPRVLPQMEPGQTDRPGPHAFPD